MEIKYNNEKWEREDFAPLSFWSWNDKMDDESIKERIKEFHEQGHQGFFMHSRGGLLTPYLTDEWFHACRVAADEAEKYGMKAWIYDEDGWPSGFAGGRVNELGEEYLAKYLIFIKEKPENDRYVITSYRKKDESYEVCEYEEGDLWAVYVTEPNYVDLLSKEVTNKFIEITHERYKKELGSRLGNVVPGFFTDEPQYLGSGFPYSFELENYFKERNGYSIEKKLYQLMPECNAKASEQFKMDYWNTIEEMMRIHFSKQIYDWCEENNVISTGHFPGEDSLIQQIESTAGVMPKYMYMQMPGIDHLGRRITPLLLTKQVASVAKQMGRKQILSETFGCAGWNISFEDMCYIWGWQASTGINVPVLHVGAHSILGIRKRDYPAFYSYQAPWWNEFNHISSWLSGIGYKMSLGKWIEDVLIISPMQSIYCTHGERGNYSNLEKQISASYRRLCDNLMDIQVGFDLGDETVINEIGSVEGSRLRIGNCEYNHIIIPEAVYLLESTWELLEQFHQSGGVITFTDRIPKGKEDRAWTKRCKVISNSRRIWNKYFQALQYKRLVSVYDKSGFHIAENLNVSVKEDDNIIRAYIWNFSVDSKRELLVSVLGNQVFYIVDPETFERRKMTSESFKGVGETTLQLTIKGKQSILLEIEKGKTEEIKSSELVAMEYVKTRPIRMDNNALTIDYATYSLNGSHYSPKLPTVKLHAPMYEELAKVETEEVYIKYQFINRTLKEIDMHVAVEDRDCIDIICNGQSIFTEKDGWYMDQGIHTYPIRNYVVTGMNEIVLKYKIENNDILDIDGLFETERNRFFYPVEPEAIYILGDFSVEANCESYRNKTHIRLQNPQFELWDEEELVTYTDVTTQGLWFYRGNIKMDFEMTYRKDERKYIQIENLEGALVEIQCNNISKKMYMEPYEIEITDHLEEGNNKISVILHGTNRNILGPHHHIKGENNFVGGRTFTGVRGWEDVIANFGLKEENTWTDEYSFVPFGCSRIIVRTDR